MLISSKDHLQKDGNSFPTVRQKNGFYEIHVSKLMTSDFKGQLKRFYREIYGPFLLARQ